MSLQEIDRVGYLAREESAQVNTKVLEKIVPRARRTFTVITPQRQIAFSKMFFSRQQQTGIDAPERWNIYGKYIWYLCGIYFTSRKQGELLIEHLQSVIDWLRTRDDDRIIVTRDFWEIEEDTACLQAARHSAKAAGNESKVSELTIAIIRNEREILERQRVSSFARLGV